MKNKSCWNWILILISIFTYGQKESITLFENEKLKISFQDGGLLQQQSFVLEMDILHNVKYVIIEGFSHGAEMTISVAEYSKYEE